MKVFLAAAVACLGACNAILGIGDPEIVGASSDAAGVAHKDAASDHTLDVGGEDARHDRGTSSGGDAASDGGGPTDAGSGTGSSGTGSGSGVKDAMALSDAGPYAAAVLEDTPIAYWRFDDMAAPMTALDSTGHGHTLSITGTYTTGVPGALKSTPNLAFLLDGMTSRLLNTSFPEFVGTAPYTLEGWIKPTESMDAELGDTMFRELFQRAAFPLDGGREGYGLFLAGGMMGLERYVDGVDEHVETTAPPTGTFTYVVGVYDGTMLILYVNGTGVGSQPDLGAAAATGVAIDVGCNTYAGHGVIEGVIDEFAIYDYALSPARIAAHFAAASEL